MMRRAVVMALSTQTSKTTGMRMYDYGPLDLYPSFKKRVVPTNTTVSG